MADPYNRDAAPRLRDGELSTGHLHIRMAALSMLVLLAGMAAGIMIERGTTDGSQSSGTSFVELGAVADLVTQNYYYRPADPEEAPEFAGSLEQSAIDGMLRSLDDDYTRYLPPAEAQVAAEELEGEYGGIGVTLLEMGGVLSVARVGPDSPASNAGINPGDEVHRIDNRPIASIDQSLHGVDLRGPVGSTVVLTVLRPGADETTEIRVVREAIIVHPVSFEMISGTSYLMIRIDIFGDRTTLELDEALAFGTEQGAEGIVLDLRGNGGGWVVAAQETIGRFLGAGMGPALYEDSEPGRGGMSEKPIINGDLPPTDLPLIVLIDRETASAAEIVAGSLRDYDRALLIGETTFGKGSVQRIFDFRDGASLRVTVAEWFTPSRGRIQDAGVRPDVLLQADLSRSSDGDPIVNAALAFLESGTSRPTDLAQPRVPPAATPATRAGAKSRI